MLGAARGPDAGDCRGDVRVVISPKDGLGFMDFAVILCVFHDVSQERPHIVKSMEAHIRLVELLFHRIVEGIWLLGKITNHHKSFTMALCEVPPD